MKRRLLGILSVISLTLFAAVVVAWGAAVVLSVVSGAPRWAQPYVAWRDGPAHGRAVMVTRWSLSLESRGLPWSPQSWPSRGIYDPAPDAALESADRMLVRMHRIPDVSWLGLEKGHWMATIGDGFRSGPVRGDYISIPLWLLLLAFGALPARWALLAARRRRQKRVGLCARCGYDLRATPERCPECGAVRQQGGAGETEIEA